MDEMMREVNGLRFYTMPNRYMRQFCLTLYIKAGPMYKNARPKGVTHLFEHIVFRNIKQKYDGRLYEQLALNGIFFDATTYYEFLCFKVYGLPTGIELAADIISSIFDDLHIEESEFELEKQRIISEILEEDEKYTLSYFTRKRVWKGTSIDALITGSPGDLKKISQKRLNAYKKSILKRGNVFLFGTGNIGNEEMAVIEKRLGSVNIPEGGQEYNNVAPVPENFGNRPSRVYVKESDYYRVRLCFDVDNTLFDTAVRDYLYYILFYGECSMINKALSEDTGLIYSFENNIEQYTNISTINLEYEIGKETLQRSVEMLVKVLQKLKSGDFNYEIGVKNVFTSWEMTKDNAESINWYLAYENHILCAEPIDGDGKTPGRYAGLTKERVIHAAREIFRTRNLTLAVKGSRYYVNKMNLLDVVKELDDSEE